MPLKDAEDALWPEQMQSLGLSTTDREFLPVGTDKQKRSLMTTQSDPSRKSHVATTRNWTKNRWARQARAEICGEKFHSGAGVDSARLDKFAQNKMALPQQVYFLNLQPNYGDEAKAPIVLVKLFDNEGNEYAERRLPAIGRLLLLRPGEQPGAQAKVRVFESIHRTPIQTHALPTLPVELAGLCLYRSGLYRFKCP